MSYTTITPEEKAKWRNRLTLLKREVENKGFRHGCAEMALRLMDALEQAEARAEKAEAENARLRERLEAALDKIADIEEDSNAYTSKGACHACGICAGCPEDWEPTDDHCCRVMLELWADGEPLPWEASARRAVAAGEG